MMKKIVIFLNVFILTIVAMTISNLNMIRNDKSQDFLLNDNVVELSIDEYQQRYSSHDYYTYSNQKGLNKQLIDLEGVIEFESELIFISFENNKIQIPFFNYYLVNEGVIDISYIQADTLEIETNIVFLGIYYPTDISGFIDLMLNVQVLINEGQTLLSINVVIDDLIMSKIVGNVLSIDNIETKNRLDESVMIQSGFSQITINNSKDNKIYLNSISPDNYDHYTNEKRFIREYEKEYMFDYRLPNSNIITDDHIVKLIPKELMFNVGEHLYIGKEYGFFIKTIIDLTKKEDYMSLVLIFDIINVLPSSSSLGDGMTSVVPLFQFTYKAVDKNNRSGIWDQFDPDLNRVVFPHVQYTQNKYFINNVNFRHSIFNATSLNEGDKGYNIDEDQGGFITQTRYNSKGIGLKRKKNIFLADTLEVAIGFIPIIDNVISIGKYIKKHGGAFLGMLKGDIIETYNVESYDNDKNITSFFQNHSEQANEYKHYIRTVTTTSVPNENAPKMLSTTNGDYAQSIYRVNRVSTDSPYDEIQVRNSIDLQIVNDQTKINIFGKETGELIPMISSSSVYEYSDYIRNENIYNDEKEINVQLISNELNKRNVFIVDNQRTDNYLIKTSKNSNDNSEIKLIVRDLNNNKVITGYQNSDGNSSLDINLIAGHLYIIEIWKSIDDGDYNYFFNLIPSFKDIITFESYKFENQYYYHEIMKTIYSSNGNEIITNRLRTGYISYSGKQYLTLSAKRNNAGTAFIEYTFDKEITKINYELALWSTNEGLTRNSEICLEVLNSDNEWILIRKFNPSLMSTNKDFLVNYSNEILIKTYSFRFIIRTNDVTNENNKGRMVIGNIFIN